MMTDVLGTTGGDATGGDAGATERDDAGGAYAEALAYLYGLVDWERRPMDRSTRERLLLERPAALLDRLGHPQRRYRAVLVGGTKGKGSTAAMLASILRAAGRRTGFYSQPHLHTYRERIRVDGALISPAEVVGGVARVRPHAEALERERPELGACTTYEVGTALALDYFARADVEVAVLEVGLGGRLDATNVVAAGLAVITSLSLDHTAILGDTLPEIAGEKAGIIKPGRPVLVAPQRPEAMAVLERVAGERGAPLGAGGRDWTWAGGHRDFVVEAPAARRGLWPAPWHHVGLEVPLLGAHQLENAATAVAAAHALFDAGTGDAGDTGRRGPPEGPAAADRGGVLEAVVAAGLATTCWPARFEIVRPSDVGPAVVVDGAHNADSAAKLAAALHAHVAFDRLWLVVGVGIDKDLAGIVAPLAPPAAGAWAVASRHARSRRPGEVASALRAAGIATHEAVDTAAGLAGALAAAGPRDAVCVTGSLFVAAEAREALGLVSPHERDPL
jgi:dihydrofolate synthase/folylpolyglutamate synthase